MTLQLKLQFLVTVIDDNTDESRFVGDALTFIADSTSRVDELIAGATDWRIQFRARDSGDYLTPWQLRPIADVEFPAIDVPAIDSAADWELWKTGQ